MLNISEAIIVEGKYDVQRLKEFISSPVIPTSGFRIFKDKEKQTLIRKLAVERGIVILTDSDGAGLVIRNFIKGICPEASIKNCYVPQIRGKEKRKTAPSKEGIIGVEGLTEKIISDSLVRCGVLVENNSEISCMPITKSDLYEMGLSGRENSAILRKKLMLDLELPTYLSTNAFLETINSLYTKQELLDKLNAM